MFTYFYKQCIELKARYQCETQTVHAIELEARYQGMKHKQYKRCVELEARYKGVKHKKCVESEARY